MSDFGHVKISRKAYASDIFWNESREFSKWEAWEWMIQAAAWKDHRRVVGMKVVDLKRGELLSSLRYLSEAWGWSTKKVRVFIALLIDMDRIRAQRETPAGTVYLLVNYDSYQSVREERGTPQGTDGAQAGHRQGTGRAQREAVKAGKAGKADIPPTILKLHARDDREAAVDEIIRAANRGMVANDMIGDACHPIPVSHGSRQTVLDWLSDGIRPDVAAETVRQRAQEYRPNGRRKQITTMNYFDGAVRDEWDRTIAKEVSGGEGERKRSSSGRSGGSPKVGEEIPPDVARKWGYRIASDSAS